MFDESMDAYKNIINQYDAYDRTSEFYRYPLTKNGEFTRNKLWKEPVDLNSNEIDKKKRYFIYNIETKTIDVKYVYNVDKKALFFKDKFYVMLNYFMKLSPFFIINKNCIIYFY